MQQALYVGDFLFFEVAVQVAVGHFPRQVQGAEYQLAGFVPGIVGAMPEKQLFPMETADSPTDMVAQGAQAGSDHGADSWKKRLAILTAFACTDDVRKTRCRTSVFIQIASIAPNTPTS